MRAFLFFAVLIVAGCAKQTALSGGERDTVPPQALEYRPPLFATQFQQRSFSITFDEFFSVDNLASKLIVSPPLDYPVEYEIRRKTLTVTWQDTLLPHTTYQFNFGGAIVDLTERNPTTDLVYVFSTGDYIDSLTIGGSLTLARDNTPLQGAAVMLYQGQADSLPLTSKPNYFGMSGPNGTFDIRYLPEGDFKMFVLKEENTNYLYNGPPEIIGFPVMRPTAQLADSTATRVHIPTFIEPDTSFYILSTEQRDFGFYQTVFSRPAVDPSIQFTIPDTDIEMETASVLSKNRDTLRTWLRLPEDNIGELRVIVRDESRLADTSFWYLETDPKYMDQPSLEMRANIGAGKLDRNRDLTLTFTNPIIEVDTGLIQLIRDSVSVPIPAPVPSASGLKYSFQLDPQPDHSYLLIVDGGAFKGYFGEYNDSTAFSYSLRDTEYYGTLSLKVNDSLFAANPNPIVQFLSPQGTVLRTDRISDGGSIHYPQLAPGKYGLKLVFDRNDNMQWDPGSYAEKRQPEKVVIYPDPIEVRSNWDLELEWTPAPPAWPTQE